MLSRITKRLTQLLKEEADKYGADDLYTTDDLHIALRGCLRFSLAYRTDAALREPEAAPSPGCGLALTRI